jgi:hypothetical protein
MREGGRVWAVGYDVMLEECNFIVMRDIDNDFGPVGCEHISAALRELTGLQKLDLSCTCLHDCCCCGALCVNRGSCQKYGFCLLFMFKYLYLT